MAFVPPVPGYSPVSYGQGFGNWQQYAGYNKDNPFGVSPDIMAKTPTPVPPSAPAAIPPVDTTFQTPDYSIKPSTYGGASVGQFGGSTQTEATDSLSLSQQARKHWGE